MRSEGDLPGHESLTQSEECVSESVDAAERGSLLGTGSFTNVSVSVGADLCGFGDIVKGQVKLGRRGEVVRRGCWGSCDIVARMGIGVLERCKSGDRSSPL